MVTNGDRFRVKADTERLVWIVRYAPAHSEAAWGVVPRGTVLVANDESPPRPDTPRTFSAYPEQYEEKNSRTWTGATL